MGTSGTAFDQASHYAYDYDQLGQLTSASNYQGTDFLDKSGSVADQTFGYLYDSIGNRLESSQGLQIAFEYSPNLLNQYQEIVHPASVASDFPVHDADGNLVQQAGWEYVWNAENMLIDVKKTAPQISDQRLSFKYDSNGRRIEKRVWEWSGSNWTPLRTHVFVWAGWEMLAERITDEVTEQVAVTRYLWGLDLVGSTDASGGVGALLAIDTGDTHGVYFFDANGNVGQVVDTLSGNLLAHYEYSPFGDAMTSTGSFADSNTFRFSTKYQDPETNLLYYGYRYYDSSTGRWLNRDPIQEQGGLNLYGFVENDPVALSDVLGLALYAFDGTGTNYSTWTHVSILHRSYIGIAEYEDGVGSSWYNKIYGGVFGIGGRYRLESMYKKLVRNYMAGDKEIDIIGFSRGSALAREFANMIYDRGIAEKSGWTTIGPRNRERRIRQYNVIECNPIIRFVGLFDTVGSFGVPGNHINIGIKMDLPPNVKYAAHAIAADERRSAFPLTPLNQLYSHQIFFQKVFSGDHSDVGGGHKQSQNLLSLVPLFFMHGKGLDAGVPFGGIGISMQGAELFLSAGGEKRPWPYQINLTPHDLTTKFYYRDGGKRDNLPK